MKKSVSFLLILIAAITSIVLIHRLSTVPIVSNSCRLLNSERVTCNSLPDSAKVSSVLREHNDLVQKILDVNPEHITVNRIPVSACSDKSMILIEYASEEECKQIREVMNADDFFGVPYGLQNV